MMTKFRFLMAAIMLAGFVSCNKGNVDDIDGDDASNTHMVITISAVDNTPGTKGAEDSGSVDPGTSDEFQVKTLDLFLFDGSGFVEHIALGAGDISGTTLPGGGGNVASAKTRKIAIDAGTYQIFTIANYGGVVPALSTGDPISDLRDALIGNATYTGGLITPIPGTGLMMASRTKDTGVASPISNLTIDNTHTVNNPAELKVTMERVVAKLTLKSPAVDGTAITAANTYKVGTSDAECSIEVESFVVANLRNEGYIFRHAWDPTGSATGYGDIDDTPLQNDASNPFKYVWDPKSASKTYTGGSLAASYATWYHRHVTTLSASTMSNTISMSGYQSADNKLIGYCLENTALATSQRDGYSTGVIFRAKITPATEYFDNGGTLDSRTGSLHTVFYYGGKFYETTAALVLDTNTPFNDVAELNGMTAKQMSDLGIEKYTDGICFYNYWIKHQDNSDPTTMGMMEYGIVRNNTYRMQITEIKRPGEGDIFITPEDPNEKVNLYLSVEMSILPWFVRANDIVFD